jgi:uncharacterized membrane protein YjdF
VCICGAAWTNDDVVDWVSQLSGGIFQKLAHFFIHMNGTDLIRCTDYYLIRRGMEPRAAVPFCISVRLMLEGEYKTPAQTRKHH